MSGICYAGGKIGMKKPGGDENTLLLLHGNNIGDSSIYNNLITNSGVVSASENSKFGGSSLYFNGNSYLKIPLTINGDFTIDFWINIKERLSGKTWVCPFHVTNNGSRGLLLYLVSNITYLCDSSNNTSNTAISTGTWHHIAVTRSGSSAKMYLNGSLLLSSTTASFNGNELSIGYDPLSPGDTPLYGYIDEFRLSNVVRWDSNFTPPTSEHKG